MKNLPIFVFFLFILISSNSQAQWQRILNVPVFNYGYSIKAIGDNFAVISAYQNKIFITTDAGNTWIQKFFPKDYAADISLVDKNTFYAAADDGTFYKTSDGGDNWTIIYSNPQRTGFGNYIEMFDQNDGVAMGDAHHPSNVPLFLRTTDGTTWIETCNQALGGGAADDWASVDFANPNVGYYSPKGGPPPRKLCKTTDGGFNWVETDFDVYADVLKFYDKDFGFLAHAPNVYRTTDGGINWQSFPMQAPDNYHSQDIEFVPNNPDKIWMSYAHGLLFSADSGKTWTQQTMPNLTNAFDITFANEMTGWLLCTDGKLFYTNNCGGLITRVAQEINLPTSFKLFQNYPNPFNPETAISYQISAISKVSLRIYDLLGREVAMLINEEKTPGYYSGMFNAESLPSGIYFYKLTAGNFSSTKKMILLK